MHLQSGISILVYPVVVNAQNHEPGKQQASHTH